MKYQLTDCVIFYKESVIANTSLSVDQVLLVTFSGVKMAGRATDVVRILNNKESFIYRQNQYRDFICNDLKKTQLKVRDLSTSF